MRKRCCKLLVIVLSLLIGVSCNSSPVAGFAIVEPKPGAIYHPGDRISLKALTGPNERPIAVYLYATQMQFAELFTTEPYILNFTIPAAFTGRDTLVASAKFADGTMIEAEIEINVVLLANVVLTGISVSPTFILLQKMPPGSDPIKVSAYETESVAVGGIYSDGVKREITASTSGTTYSSSDEKVVTVSPEGDVTAQGLGTATITVRNGKYSATVKVVVKPYKK